MGSAAHQARPNRESVAKRIGKRNAAALHARDGHACVYCGATAETSGDRLQLDHLTARSEGGLDRVENLVLACRKCNRAKSADSLETWCAKIGYQPEIVRAWAAQIA